MSQRTEPSPLSIDQDDFVLPVSVRQHLGAQLRAFYGLPEELIASAAIQVLLERLSVALTAQSEALTAEIRDGLAAHMPDLMRYALSLTKDPSAQTIWFRRPWFGLGAAVTRTSATPTS